MLKVRYLGAEEMSQWLRVLIALTEDPGFPAPTRHLTNVCNSNCCRSDTHLWPPRVPGMHMVHRHTGKQNTHPPPQEELSMECSH